MAERKRGNRGARYGTGEQSRTAKASIQRIKTNEGVVVVVVVTVTRSSWS